MPADGSNRLRVIAAELRAAGDRENMLALRRGLRVAARPLVPAVKDAARRQLPKRGGLNEQVAGQRVSVRTALTARTTAVRLTTSAPDTRQTDQGYVRHPTFGRRGPGQWQRQSIPQAAGWWSRTLNEAAPAVRAALAAEIEAVAARISRSV